MSSQAKGYEVDGAMSDLASYSRSPDYVSKEFYDTVLEISEIVGKSIMTLHRTI